MTEAYFSNNPYYQLALPAPRKRPRPRAKPKESTRVTKEQLIKELAKMVARADRYEERETTEANEVESFMYWSGYKTALYDLINTIEGGTETENYHAVVVDATDWPQLELVVDFAARRDLSIEVAMRTLVNEALR
jgi:hypothetical protein